LNTIREAFAFNLRLLRGNKTQAEMAEFLSLPLSTYQKLESGQVPQRGTMEAITQKLGVSEVSLVQLPGEAPPPSPVSPRLAAIGEAVTILCTLNEFELDGVTAFLRGVAGTDAAASAPLAPRARKAK
jgi:transcriptional regulator with XRE-family HTH domain